MELKDLRLQRWPLLGALWLCLTFSGCATGRVKVTAEVVDPEQAKSRSVMVVPDAFMNDAAEADTVAALLRGQLASLGFSVKETEEDAELVVVPTIERSAAASAGAIPARMRRPFDVSHGVGHTGLMESQNALRNLGFELKTLPEQEQPRIGLMVTAISKEVWLNTLLASESEIPRVWRVVALASLNKEDMTTKLVEAVGAKLSEITSAPVTPNPPVTTPPPSPTPSATPEKKP